MEKMIEDGCNLVVHTMSEHDVAYHSQTMIDIVQVSRDVGLEVFLDPWGVGRVFGGESFSAFVKLFPEARQRLSFTEGGMNRISFMESLLNCLVKQEKYGDVPAPHAKIFLRTVSVMKCPGSLRMM